VPTGGVSPYYGVLLFFPIKAPSGMLGSFTGSLPLHPDHSWMTPASQPDTCPAGHHVLPLVENMWSLSASEKMELRAQLFIFLGFFVFFFFHFRHAYISLFYFHLSYKRDVTLQIFFCTLLFSLTVHNTGDQFIAICGDSPSFHVFLFFVFFFLLELGMKPRAVSCLLGKHYHWAKFPILFIPF
jgi:hypothetical protein